MQANGCGLVLGIWSYGRVRNSYSLRSFAAKREGGHLVEGNLIMVFTFRFFFFNASVHV